MLCRKWVGGLQRVLPSKPEDIRKRQKLLKDEETQTASEGEGFFDPTDNKNKISRSCSVDIPWLCLHEFSSEQLCAMCNTEKMEEKYFKQYTGRKSSQKFTGAVNAGKILKLTLQCCLILMWATVIVKVIQTLLCKCKMNCQPRIFLAPFPL